MTAITAAVKGRELVAWHDWWIWGIAAVILAGLEMVVSVRVFLALAVGAGTVAWLLMIGGPLGNALAGSLVSTLMVFVAVSLVVRVLVRRRQRAGGGE